MNDGRVKNSGGKLAPRSILRVGAALQDSRKDEDRPNEGGEANRGIDKMRRIGTWNVRTALIIGKMENIKIEMKRLRIDILGLSEMRWPNEGDFWTGDVRMIHTAAKNGQAGVGMMLDKKWGRNVSSFIAYNERLLLVKIKGEPNDTNIIQVYMPTSRADDEELEKTYAEIEELLKLTKAKDNTIIMGDWNAVVGKGQEGREVGAYGIGNRNERGDRLVEFCQEHGMVVTNTTFKHHPRRLYTWKMPGDIRRYQIDFILVKNRFKNQVKNCKAYPGADVNSDHNLIVMKCNLSFKKIKKKERFNHRSQIRRLKEPMKAKEFRERGEELMEMERDEDNTSERWKRLKSIIKTSARETLTTDREGPNKQWINEEIIKDIEERRRYKNRTDLEGQKRYKELRNKINRDSKKAKEEWLEDKCEEIEKHMKNNQIEQAFQKAKRFFGEQRIKGGHIRGSNGELLLEGEDIAERWKEYLEELYEGEDIDMRMENTRDPEEQGAEILYEEFEAALRDLKGGRAPGVDEIPIELIKQSGDSVRRELYAIIKNIYVNGEMPEDFTRVIAVPIPKKARAERCSHFRTLFMVTHASKILTKIIHKRIERKVDEYLGWDQYGFRKKKGTREALLGLRQMQEKQLERNKKTYLAFVDLEKAFDRLNWKFLFKTLDMIGIDHRDKELIYNMYRRQEAEVRVNDNRATAKIRRGVRQGCTLSPSLFNVYIEDPINEIKSKLNRWNIGVKIGGVLINMIRFADDIVLIAESERDLERALEQMRKAFDDYDMKINQEKTKIMAFDKKGQIPAEIEINNHRLEEVTEYRYLGGLITTKGTCKREIVSRIAQAKRAFMVRKEILLSRRMGKELRKRLIKTYVWSVALYGCETWTMNLSERCTLEAFEMWCWRKMEKISYTERKTNDEVLRMVKEPRSLMRSIKDRRWKMMGHVLRHGEEMHATIVEGMVEGRRGAGRPRTAYISQLQEDAGVTGYKELKEMANDREEWRRRGELMQTNLRVAY